MIPIVGQQTVGTQAFDPGIALLQVAEFDAAYSLSLSAARRAYMALPYNSFLAGSATAPTRTTPAILDAEAAKGDLDTQVQVWGDSACRTFVQRLVQGYPWVYAFGGGSIPVGPGLSVPGMPSYSTTPPAGADVILTPKWDTNGYLIMPEPFPSAPVEPPPATVGPMAPNGLYEILGTIPPVGTAVGNYVVVSVPNESMFATGTPSFYFMKVPGTN